MRAVGLGGRGAGGHLGQRARVEEHEVALRVSWRRGHQAGADAAHLRKLRAIAHEHARLDLRARPPAESRAGEVHH